MYLYDSNNTSSENVDLRLGFICVYLSISLNAPEPDNLHTEKYFTPRADSSIHQISSPAYQIKHLTIINHGEMWYNKFRTAIETVIFHWRFRFTVKICWLRTSARNCSFPLFSPMRCQQGQILPFLWEIIKCRWPEKALYYSYGQRKRKSEGRDFVYTVEDNEALALFNWKFAL